MFHPSALPRTTLGSTGRDVTRLGLGGEGVLRTFGLDAEAHEVISAALDAGITYLESARAYQGSESYYGAALGMGHASPAHRGAPAIDREQLFLASKAHDRTKAGARAMLETTLRSMKLEYLDLWQFHDVREWDEVEALEDPEGAYAAFAEAKREGLVRFIGVTGHAAPDVLRAAFERVPFDTVLLPVNPAEGCSPDSFEQHVIPAARARGMGVVGMKVFARGLLFHPQVRMGAGDALAYALGADLDVVVVGCDDPEQVAVNAAAAAAVPPMAQLQRRALEERVRQFAGQLRYYRRPASAAS